MQVALKVYSDGSGMSSDPNTPFLVLSGLIASPGDWGILEAIWDRVLEDHKSPPWHSSDAYALQEEFRDWSHDRVRALRNDLYVRCFQENPARDRFVHANCVIDLGGYRRAVQDMPAVGDLSPETLCAYWIASNALGCLPDSTDDPLGKDGLLELYFDQGEPYINVIQKEWEQRKRYYNSDIVSRIVTVAPADHRRVLAIQAADFLAWHTNRGHTQVESHQTARAFGWFAVPITHRLWDYDLLIRACAERSASKEELP